MKENNIWQELSLNTIYNMDCIEGMKLLADNSVDAIVTDPPYWLSFMGKKRDYDVPSQEIREEALRVLKPWWYLLSFAGTRTQHRMAVRIEDAGFEIRDMIAWVYGSGFPKSLNIGKAVDKKVGNDREVVGEQVIPYKDENRSVLQPKDGWNDNSLKTRFDITKGTSPHEGWGTALKPALEPITVARKPIEGTVAENCLKWGTGGINIDWCRVEMPDREEYEAKQRTFLSATGKVGEASWKNSSPLNDPETSIENSKLGRFPANFIHDWSDEVVELFPNTKSGGGKTTRKNKDAIFDFWQWYSRDEISDSGSASRFFYCAKASKSERNKGCENIPIKDPDYRTDTGKGSYVDKWIAPQSNSHPTVKPIALMEYLVKLVSREDAVVLDPFTWSWSTLIACKKLNRQYIWFELDEDYITIAEARLQSIKSENTLFS